MPQISAQGWRALLGPLRWDSRERAIAAAAGLGALTILLIDCVLPLGYAVYLLYSLVVLSALAMARRDSVWLFAAVATVCLLIGALASRGGIVPNSVVVFNRGMGLLAIWGCALFVVLVRQLQSDIEERKARFADVIDSAMDAIISVDEEQRIVLFNHAAVAMFRCSVAEAVGGPLTRFIPERLQAVHAEHIRGFAETGVTRRRMGQLGTISGRRADGETFAAEGAISQIDIGDRRLFTVILRDLGDTRVNAARNARAAAIIASSPDPIMSIALDGTIQSWNGGAERLFGYDAKEAIGQNFRMLVPEDRAEEVAAVFRRVIGGASVVLDTVHHRRNGESLDVTVTTAPVRAADGGIAGVSAIAHDITEHKRHEKHIGFLMHELAHRSKNLLAVIQAIASQSARHSASLPDFLARFTARLQGLARSQDVLVDRNWKEAPLADVVRAQVAPFAEIDGLRIEMRGPHFPLDADAAQAVGLALHELATNASKYGALSVPTGKVEISWKMIGEGDERRLRLRWRERGGPVVAVPERKGFGRMVIEPLVAQAADGTATVDFAPEGVTWTLEIRPAKPK